jgi:hypothetical protein
MFSSYHLFSRPRISASAAGCRRGGAELTVFSFQINLGARGDAGPFLTTDRGASAIRIGRLTPVGRSSEAAWIKSQERSATDELR